MRTDGLLATGEVLLISGLLTRWVRVEHHQQHGLRGLGVASLRVRVPAYLKVGELTRGGWRQALRSGVCDRRVRPQITGPIDHHPIQHLLDITKTLILPVDIDNHNRRFSSTQSIFSPLICSSLLRLSAANGFLPVHLAAQSGQKVYFSDCAMDQIVAGGGSALKRKAEKRARRARAEAARNAQVNNGAPFSVQC